MPEMEYRCVYKATSAENTAQEELIKSKMQE